MSSQPSTTSARLDAQLDAPPPARRILVARLGALGDVVRTRIAFAGLRELYPHSSFDWLVEDRAASALDGITGLDRIVSVPRTELRTTSPASAFRRLGALVHGLRARSYDLAIDFHGILKSALLIRASRTPIRVGYDHPFAREGSQLFYTHRVRVRPSHLSRFERNAALVRFLGGAVPRDPPPLELPVEATRAVDRALPDRPVVIHPGTSAATLYKRWSSSRYGEVARRLREARGWPCVVTWGPVRGERECAEEVVAESRGAATLGPRTSGPAELLAILSRARLFIGSDSGPMHLASLAACPLVVLFGPTDPVENTPFAGVPFRILRHDVGCNPCREGCPARVCMESVGVEEVVSAALELVAAPPGVQ